MGLSNLPTTSKLVKEGSGLDQGELAPESMLSKQLGQGGENDFWATRG